MPLSTRIESIREKQRALAKAEMARPEPTPALQKPKKRKRRPNSPGWHEVMCSYKHGRLPHDSTFNASYDATARQWTGTLTVREIGTFTGTHSGLFKLLHAIDQQYRAAIAAKA